MVVLFHAGLPLPGGFFGVDVFFVVSGFVITAKLVREYSETGSVRIVEFFKRRFWRLVPALAVVVSMTAILSFFVLSPFGQIQDAAMTGLGAMFMLANIVIALVSGNYFDAPAELNPLLNTWSLSVEEQFYVIVPLLLLIAARLARGRVMHLPLLKKALLVIGAASFALFILGSTGISFWGSWATLGFYSPVTRAWEFAIGALLATSYSTGQPSWASRIPGMGWGVVGAVLLSCSAIFYQGEGFVLGLWTIAPVVATGFLIVAGGGLHDDNFVSTSLSRSLLVKTGSASYSIYLWHWPLIVFSGAIWPESQLAAPLGALFSFLPAVISYFTVEIPFRSQDIRSRAPKRVVAALVVLLPVASASASLFLADQWLAPSIEAGKFGTVREVQSHSEFHEWISVRYFPCTPLELRQNALHHGGYLRCQQSFNDRPVEIAIIGDSHAEDLFPGLAEVVQPKNVAYYIGDNLPIADSSLRMRRSSRTWQMMAISGPLSSARSGQVGAFLSMN